FIQTHDVSRKLKSLAAQRRSNQTEGGIPLAIRHFCEANSLPSVEVLVHPFTPLDVVYRIHASGQLQRVQSADEPLCRAPHRCGRDPCRFDLKQLGYHLAIGRDSLEGFCQAFLLVVFRHPVKALCNLRSALTLLLPDSPGWEHRSRYQERKNVSARRHRRHRMHMGMVMVVQLASHVNLRGKKWRKHSTAFP